MASFTNLSQLLHSEATNFSAYPRICLNHLINQVNTDLRLIVQLDNLWPPFWVFFINIYIVMHCAKHYHRFVLFGNIADHCNLIVKTKGGCFCFSRLRSFYAFWNFSFAFLHGPNNCQIVLQHCFCQWNTCKIVVH